MESLGTIIKKTEEITDITACFNFIDSLNLAGQDFRLVIEARCRTLGTMTQAYKRYGTTLISQSQQRSMLLAAQSSAGYSS